MVSAEISGNIVRAPKRSVSAPTGIRPSDPTTTGTATSNDFCSGDSCSRPAKNVPIGLIRAHAQKFTAKPSVATASMVHACRGTASTSSREGTAGLVRACAISESPFQSMCGLSGSCRTVSGVVAPRAPSPVAPAGCRPAVSGCGRRCTDG